jgi:hypothetical protein
MRRGVVAYEALIIVGELLRDAAAVVTGIFGRSAA